MGVEPATRSSSSSSGGGGGGGTKLSERERERWMWRSRTGFRLQFRCPTPRRLAAAALEGVGA